MPKTISMLEEELDEARERCLAAEQDSLELVQRYEGLLQSREAEIAALQTPPKTIDPYCPNCRSYRIYIMLWQIAAAYLIWQLIFAPAPAFGPEERTITLLILCLWPAVSFAFWVWRRRFKVKYAWRGPFDNDLYRAAEAWWNEMLDSLRLG